jgi:predicted nucleic acid-binding protein
MEPAPVNALVDTDVLIDILRGTSAARAWLASTPATAFDIPSIVGMELLVGCRDQTELRRVQRFLDAFTIAWTDAAESARAYELLATHRLTLASASPIAFWPRWRSHARRRFTASMCGTLASSLDSMFSSRTRGRRLGAKRPCVG